MIRRFVKKRKKIILILAIISIVAIGFTYTNTFARLKVNYNLNAYEVKMGMSLEELFDLNLGTYESSEDKYSVNYIFEEKGLVVDVDRNNRVCQLQMRKPGSSVYGIIIGETTKDEANNILLKKRGFFILKDINILTKLNESICLGVKMRK